MLMMARMTLATLLQHRNATSGFYCAARAAARFEGNIGEVARHGAGESNEESSSSSPGGGGGARMMKMLLFGVIHSSHGSTLTTDQSQ